MSDLNAVLEEIKQQRAALSDTIDQRLSEKADKGWVESAVEERLDAQVRDITDKIDHINKEISDAKIQIDEARLYGGGASKEERELGVQADRFLLQMRAERPDRRVEAFTGEDLKKFEEYSDAYWRGGKDAVTGNMQAVMQVAVGPDGGYWVTPDRTGRISSRIFETSPIRQVAAVETISTDRLEGPADTDEISSGWVGETEPRPGTDSAQAGEWAIDVHEQYAEPRSTQKLLDDATRDVGAWLEQKGADKFSRGENTAFVTGDGNKKPRGFLSQKFAATSDKAGRPWDTVQYVITGVSGGFAAGNGAGFDNLKDLMLALKTGYRNGSRWTMNRLTMGEVMKMKDADGRPLWQPSLQPDQFNIMLLGYPILEAEDMPDMAADSYSIAFGNWGVSYQIVDRLGIRVLRDPYTTKGFVKFYMTKRVGGDAVNREAYKVMKFGTS